MRPSARPFPFFYFLSYFLSATLVSAACGSSRPQPLPQAASPSGDAAFSELAEQYLEDLYRRQPTQATSLGIHKYDDRLEDNSHQAITDEVAFERPFRDRV